MSKISVKTADKHPLTAEQKCIVKTKHRAVEVPAYAGTGKTSTLVARVEELLMRGAQPKDIVVLTFSNEGVRVLLERIKDALGDKYSGTVTIRTMHAYARSLVKERRKLPNHKQTNRMLGSVLEKELKRPGLKRRDQLVERLGTPPDLRMVLQILDLMAATRLRAEKLGLSRKSSLAGLVQHHQFFDRLAVAFAAKVKKKGFMRYGDMIGRGIEARKGGAAVPFKHLLVDEWQDSSAAIGQLVKALSKRVQTVMVLGDPRQAIFGFAGASSMCLKRLLGRARVYPLTVSFRLTRAHAGLASAFIRQEDPKAAKIVGRDVRGSRPRLVKCPNPAKQTELAVKQVQQWIEKGAAPSSIAILGRFKKQLREIEQGLVNAGLNSTAVHNKAGSPVAEALAALKLFAQIEALRGHRQQGQRLKELLGKHAMRDVPKSTMSKYCTSLSRALKSDSREGLYATCSTVVLGLGVAAANAERKALQIELNRWRALTNNFETFALLRASVKQQHALEKVHTSTVHSAKGGEWDHVIVLNVANGSMPSYMAEPTGLAMIEERSAFYVAITRAKKSLVLLESDFKDPKNKLEGRSPFLADRKTINALKVVAKLPKKL